MKAPSRDDALAVLATPDPGTLELVAAVATVRRHFFQDRVKLNVLLNIKSGLCPENCAYCSQAHGSTAPIERYTMLPPDRAVEAAGMAVEAGAKRFCMVASGRGPTPGELRLFITSVRAVKRRFPELEICACLGLLRDGQADALKGAGVHAYNHNLNTSPGHYSEICSTHTFTDRVETVAMAARAGLSPCSGALFGMGESDEDIVDLAIALRELQPDSVPVNFLIPIDGTPLSGMCDLTPLRCLRILCLMRLFFPNVEVRIAGGREVHLRSLQPLGLLIANSIFVGDYLTTQGQPAEDDLRMIADLGLRIERAEEATLPGRRSHSVAGSC